MKSFEEMWELAKSLGADVKGLSEELYNRYKDKIAEEDLEAIINLLAEIDSWHDFLRTEKIDHVDFNRLKKMLKEHSHLLDKVVLPVGMIDETV